MSRAVNHAALAPGAGRTHSSVLAECTQRALVKSLRAATRAMLDTLADKTRYELESDAILRLCVEKEDWDNDASSALPRDSTAHAIRETVKPLAEAEALLNLTTSLLRSSPATLPILTDARTYVGGDRWQCGVIGAVAYAHRVSERMLSRLAVGGKDQEAFAKEVAEEAARAEETEDEPEASLRHERCKLAVEALKAVRTECSHFRSSFHYFCSSLAKNVASSRYVDRNDPDGRQPFRLPAVELAYELGHSLNDPFCIPVGARLEAESDVRFMCSLFSTLHAVLVDERRRCTQNLLINFMRHQGSLRCSPTSSSNCGSTSTRRRARRSSSGRGEPSKSNRFPIFWSRAQNFDGAHAAALGRLGGVRLVHRHDASHASVPDVWQLGLERLARLENPVLARNCPSARRSRARSIGPAGTPSATLSHSSKSSIAC